MNSNVTPSEVSVVIFSPFNQMPGKWVKLDHVSFVHIVFNRLFAYHLTSSMLCILSYSDFVK
jgi:hypothetical protein